jgi:hypothetical protein
MRLLTLAAAGLVLGASLAAAPRALADDGDRAALSQPAALVGEQLTLTVEVLAPRGATVDVDPAHASWGNVEFVRIASTATRDEGEQVRYVFELVVAAFAPGEQPFSAAVNVITAGEVAPRLLPAMLLAVVPTLAPGDDQLSALPGPRAIEGGESPLLRPLIGAGAALVLIVLGTGIVAGAAALRRRPASAAPVAQPGLDLGPAALLMDTDPVAAYRFLGATVRAVLTRRYGIPAVALTSGELEGRMEREGLDRWQARLVGGLLQECDAVVYAGYRPAAERRHADLTMAQEIVEAGA